MAAYKLQHKAAKVGFDWPDIDPVWDKLEEELRELEEAIVDGQKEKDRRRTRRCFIYNS